MKISNCEFRIIRRCSNLSEFKRHFLKKIDHLHPVIEKMVIEPYWKEKGSFDGWCRFSTERLLTEKRIQWFFRGFDSYKITGIGDEYEFFSARALCEDCRNLLCEVHIPKTGFTEALVEGWREVPENF